MSNLSVHHRVPVEELDLGMFIVELDRPWLGTPFLFQGFQIRDQAELAQLRSCCRYVLVDEKLSDPRVRLRLGQLVERRQPPATGGLAAPEVFGAELVQSARIRETARRSVVTMMNDVRFGRTFSTELAREVVSNLVDRVSTSASAALWLTNLKRKDEYTSLHCLNVCVLALVFAHHLGLPRDQIERIGLGALLHDLAKFRPRSWCSTSRAR